MVCTIAFFFFEIRKIFYLVTQGRDQTIAMCSGTSVCTCMLVYIPECSCVTLRVEFFNFRIFTFVGFVFFFFEASSGRFHKDVCFRIFYLSLD